MNEVWELRLTPREWQVKAFEAWSSKQSGIVSVVTGGGKTVFAFMCMREYHKRYPTGRILIIVPTVALIDQWYVALQEDLGLPDDDIAIYSGEEKPSEVHTVNLLVINSAREIAPQIAAQYETLLIVDECHRAGSPVNARALRGKHTATLGLSATPERQYDSGSEDYLIPALGPIIYEYSYDQAYRDGVISQFDLVNVRVELLPDEQEKVDGITRKIAIRYGKLGERTEDDKQLKRLLLRRAGMIAQATMRIPVAAKLADIHRGQRTLLFHERVSAANTILNVLREREHSATIYHSKVSPFVRRSNLRLYRRGVFDILVTCRALDEGLNVPETTVAIIGSSTASNRQRIQRLGRVLRPAPGKERAIIYTIYASDQEEHRLLQEAQELVEITSVSWRRGFQH